MQHPSRHGTYRRVGLLTTSFPRYEGDWAGNFVLGFGRALGAMGHRVDVLAPESADGAPADFGPALRTYPVPYLRPRAWQRTFYGAGVPDNLRSDRSAWAGLLPFVANLQLQALRHVRRWDAVVSHWALPCALAAGLVRRNRPHLAVFHSADLHLLEQLPGRLLLTRLILHGASRLWFVAESQRKRYLALLPPQLREAAAARSVVSPMGIEPPGPRLDRDALRREWGLAEFTVLGLGRLVPIKGLDLLIDAVAQHRGVELLLAGEGPERAALERRARALGARVRFLGHVQGRAKSELLQAADALVCPSRPTPGGRTEGMPTAVLEAMAHGLPVIASRTGGIPELAREGREALLCAPGETAALVSAIGTLRANVALRNTLAEAGRRRALPLTWPQLSPRVEHWLFDVARREPQP